MSQAESTFITSLFWSARLLYCCGGDCCHPDRYGLRPTAHGLRKSHRINAKALREHKEQCVSAGKAPEIFWLSANRSDA